MKGTLFILLTAFCLSAENIQAIISNDCVGLPAVLNCSSASFLTNRSKVREKRIWDLYLTDLATQIKIINAYKPISMRLYIVS